VRIEEIGPAVLINGDCREAMRAMDENSVDAIVTDPPYGLTSARPTGRSAATEGAVMKGFMGLGWDHGVPGKEFWVEALRVAKPGAHLLAFGGTRTFHRLMVAIEDAGWEIRDTIMWVYGSGFPKSLDVSKAIDKAAGVEREICTGSTSAPNGKPGGYEGARYKEKRQTPFGVVQDQPDITLPATEAAKQWEGWGTALKPAFEPVIVARKPLVGTVAANVQQHGTGAINIDGCRVPTDPNDDIFAKNPHTHGGFGHADAQVYGDGKGSDYKPQEGRWPANLIHDGSDEVLALFPDSNGSGGSLPQVKITGYGDGAVGTGKSEYFGGPRTPHDSGSGSAARFFYCAKTSKKDRNEGDILNRHPTVKPTELMRYLCRLVTPPGGTVLDPFMGSASTGKAALKEGFGFVGIDSDEEHGYFDIALARIKAATIKV
jgi:site-specific DNA-methyltransferase (adenine-specific)